MNMLERSPSISRSNIVYDSIRSQILSCELRPSQRLKTAEIAAEHGVSITVVREALTRLAERGLVSFGRQQGFRVVSLSKAVLLDLTAVRVEIETLALRWSVDNGDVDWESRVLAAQHVLAHTPTNGEPWFTAHRRFHDELVSTCGSPALLQIRLELLESTELYRRWARPDPVRAPRDTAREHASIMGAALARSTEKAVAHMSTHVKGTSEVLLKTNYDLLTDVEEADTSRDVPTDVTAVRRQRGLTSS
jgi:DNA-binding GntR family transcriptional regulator